jgi:hypothetical protein
LADYDKAVKHCKKAVQLQVDHAEHHFCLGWSYGEKARHGPAWQQAILAPRIRKALEKTVSLDPNHVQARLGRPGWKSRQSLHAGPDSRPACSPQRQGPTGNDSGSTRHDSGYQLAETALPGIRLWWP